MDSLYGLVRSRPRWYIRWRGLRWLSGGCCPCCYSSPPRSDCPVCEGDYRYGPDSRHRPGLTPDRRALWRQRWLSK